MGILLGGIIPAFIFGIAIVFIKAGSAEKISNGYHLLFSAIGLLVTCGLSFLLFSDRNVTVKGASFSMLYGLCLGAALVLITISLIKYKTPMAVISPIFSMSTLITVLLSLVLFSEYKEVNTVKLLLGTFVILVGGILVGTA